MVHATLEGSSADVFYRGISELKNGQITISLPEYFEDLTESEGRTVLLTNINGYDILSSSKIKDGVFTVNCNNNISQQKFCWMVMAVRKNTGFKVDPMKDEVDMRGDLPYKYLINN